MSTDTRRPSLLDRPARITTPILAGAALACACACLLAPAQIVRADTATAAPTGRAAAGSEVGAAAELADRFAAADQEIRRNTEATDHMASGALASVLASVTARLDDHLSEKVEALLVSTEGAAYAQFTLQGPPADLEPEPRMIAGAGAPGAPPGAEPAPPASPQH